MMKYCIVAVLWFAVVAALRAAEPPYTHAATGVTLPESIAGLKRGTVMDLQAEDAGVGIPFHGEDIEATIFISAIDSAEPTTAQGIIETTKTVVKEMESSGVYSRVQFFDGPISSASPGWARGAFIASIEDERVVSFISATVKSGFSVKIRLTTNAVKSLVPQAFISEAIKIINTAKPKS